MTGERPTLVLAGDQLETLELVSLGMLGGANGYRLPGDCPDGWSVVPRLLVSASIAQRALADGQLELRDPDTTPIARLTVDATAPAEDDGAWLAGHVVRLRQPEHGPLRQRRLGADSDLSGYVVALFGGELRPADVLRVVREAVGHRLAFVLEGTDDPAAASRLIALLDECSSELSQTPVYYLPRTDLDSGSDADPALLVLRTLGVARVVDFRRPALKEAVGGAVILFTGLSGSGKSTIARALTEHLRLHSTQRIVLLDGDHVRAELASDLGFGASDRDRNLQRQAWVAARVAEAGGIAICAPIAPFESSRARMRAKVEPQSKFFLVYVATPLAVAEQRDRKGLYAKARAGLIDDFTGIDSPFEAPRDANVIIDTSTMTVTECVGVVIDSLRNFGLDLGASA